MNTSVRTGTSSNSSSASQSLRLSPVRCAAPLLSRPSFIRCRSTFADRGSIRRTTVAAGARRRSRRSLPTRVVARRRTSRLRRRPRRVSHAKARAFAWSRARPLRGGAFAGRARALVLALRRATANGPRGTLTGRKGPELRAGRSPALSGGRTDVGGDAQRHRPRGREHSPIRPNWSPRAWPVGVPRVAAILEPARKRKLSRGC